MISTAILRRLRRYVISAEFGGSEYAKRPMALEMGGLINPLHLQHHRAGGPPRTWGRSSGSSKNAFNKRNTDILCNVSAEIPQLLQNLVRYARPRLVLYNGLERALGLDFRYANLLKPSHSHHVDRWTLVRFTLFCCHWSTFSRFSQASVRATGPELHYIWSSLPHSVVRELRHLRRCR